MCIVKKHEKMKISIHKSSPDVQDGKDHGGHYLDDKNPDEKKFIMKKPLRQKVSQPSPDVSVPDANQQKCHGNHCLRELLNDSAK